MHIDIQGSHLDTAESLVSTKNGDEQLSPTSEHTAQTPSLMTSGSDTPFKNHEILNLVVPSDMPKIKFNTLVRKRSTKSNHTANIEDMLKSRPAFPSTAPAVFRMANINIVTNRQLETNAEFTNIKTAMIDSNIIVTPPRIFIKIAGFKFTSDGEENSPMGDMSVMSQDDQQAQQKRKKVMDLRVDITKYIDSDFLIYNPESIVAYHHDLRHKHKVLNMFKYVASSKLKAVCQNIKEQFGNDFDHLSVRITNDQFVERIPKQHKGMFFGEGCSKSLRLAICIAFPPIIPAVLYEILNKQDYDTGFVFRIKKHNIELIQEELMKTTEIGIDKIEIQNRKSEYSDKVEVEKSSYEPGIRVSVQQADDDF